jgi:hypothetical protein
MDQVDKRETRQPEGYLYGIDHDVVRAIETGPGHADDFMYAIKNTLYPIAMQERQRFIDYKQGEYGRFLLDEYARNYPSEYLQPARVEFGPPSSQVSVTFEDSQEGVQQTKVPELDADTSEIRYKLGPLKNRYIDPLVMSEAGPRRLSDLDPNYKQLLGEQQQLQARTTVVELAFAGGFKSIFREGVAKNDAAFQEQQSASPMTHDQRRHIIEGAAARAREIGEAAGTLILRNDLAAK